MRKNKIGVALFNCGGRKDILNRITQMGEDGTSIKVIENVKSAFDLVQNMEQDERNILIFRINGKKELAAALAVLKASRGLIDDKSLKPVALMSIDSVQVEEMLVMHGCREIFSASVDIDKLFRKLNFWLSSYAQEAKEVIEQDTDLIFDCGENFEAEVDKIFQKYDETSSDELSVLAASSTIGSEKEIVQDTNLESGVLETKVKMNGKEHSLSCILDHFESNSMDLEIQASEKIHANSEIKVNVRFVYDGCSVDITTSGSVESYEEIEDGNYILNVKLMKDESAKIENFMALFQKRQDEVHKFMEKAQGTQLYAS